MTARFTTEFVTSAPATLADGVLYVSIPYATLLHLCACGCGNEVALPLSPADYSLTYDGDTITLRPSVGNWSSPCRSHYLIRFSRVVWADDWDDRKIEAGRARDYQRRAAHYAEPVPAAAEGKESSQCPPRPWWRRIFRDRM